MTIYTTTTKIIVTKNSVQCANREGLGFWLGDWHDCAIRLYVINGGGYDDVDADDGDGGGDDGGDY